MCLVTFFDHPYPLVFAHRGGCALGPENTLAAFDLGLTAGADGLELDVHLSADGVPVVHHDATLDRTTSASGPIAARTAKELGDVDAGCHFADGDAFPFRDRGIGVPTLAEVLRRYQDVRIIVEMKVDSTAMGEAMARDVRRAGAAALDLAYVAAGRLDGFWEFGLQPWDMAAGVLLIREAGGLVTDVDGGEQYMESGNIITGTPKVLRALVKVITPICKARAS